MKKLVYSSFGYTIFGLLAGLFYREFPKIVDAVDRVGESQLSVVHTHSFTLGTFFFLFVLILAKLFQLDTHKHFRRFFATYHIGLGITTLTMLAHGIYVTLGNEPHAAFSGIAGIGHIIITIGFVYFFYILIQCVNQDVAVANR